MTKNVVEPLEGFTTIGKEASKIVSGLAEKFGTDLVREEQKKHDKELAGIREERGPPEERSDADRCHEPQAASCDRCGGTHAPQENCHPPARN